MRPAVTTFAITCALLVSIGTLDVHAAPPIHSNYRIGDYRIVLPRLAIGAGERVELRLEPPAPPGVVVHYWVQVGTTAMGMNPYRAPYVIPSGAPPVQVSATFSGPTGRVSTSAEIALRPGSVNGAESCLGPGQSFSPAYGDFVSDRSQVDVGPTVLRYVEPEYPRSTFNRGIEDTIVCRALVCRSGRLLDVVHVPRFRGPEALQQIQDDPKLVEAALAAVRQYAFSPALAAGQPVAGWVDTFVLFHR